MFIGSKDQAYTAFCVDYAKLEYMKPKPQKSNQESKRHTTTYSNVLSLLKWAI